MNSNSDEVDARVELRERFLRFISFLTGGKRCDLKLYDNRNYKCNVRAFDSNFENLVVDGFVAPRPVPDGRVIIRISDDSLKSSPQHLEENNLMNDYLQLNEVSDFTISQFTILEVQMSVFLSLTTGSSKTSSSHNNYNEEESKNECQFVNESESEDEDKI
ncbi:hypothetical protein FQA39_LY15251 [Lamprigera yunnana]|nr:hypothetical protein FQA39_LY15251 [Lamprigera yunnana]